MSNGSPAGGVDQYLDHRLFSNIAIMSKSIFECGGEYAGWHGNQPNAHNGHAYQKRFADRGDWIDIAVANCGQRHCRPPNASAIEARGTLVRLPGGAKGAAPEGHVLVSARSSSCLSDGSAGGSKTAAFCILPSGRSLNCVMTATGKALAWPRYMRVRKCRGTR